MRYFRLFKNKFDQKYVNAYRERMRESVMDIMELKKQNEQCLYISRNDFDKLLERMEDKGFRW
jgi:CBS-domain-containing membrane protein